jgi:hypothetical protein
MARARRFDIDELLVRPGTYFNPETEVLIVVDDSPQLDQATFDDEGEPEGGDWVLVSDDAPIDDAARDELLERFQATYREGGRAGAELDDADELDDEDLDDEEDELEPDPDPDELD